MGINYDRVWNFEANVLQNYEEKIFENDVVEYFDVE